jgi:aspartyl protease family protein
MNDMPNLWGEKPGRRRGPWRLTLLIAALVVGVLALLWRFPYDMANGGDWASLGYMLALLVMVSAGFAWQRPNLPKMFRHAVIWVGVAIVIGMGYAYRFELSTVRDRFLGELVLGQGQEGIGGEIRFRVGDGGHFRLEAFVNDLPV